MLSRKESKEKGERWGARERRGSPELASSLTSYRRLRRNGEAAIGQPGGGALGFRGGECRGKRGLLKGTDAEGDCGLQWPEGITAGVIAAGAAAIRGRGRPDRWDPPVGVREREGGRGDGAGLRCGRSWAGAGPFRPVSASLAVLYIFF